MEKSRAIELLEHLAWDRDIDRNPYGNALNIAIDALKAQLSQEGTTSDLISRQAAIDAFGLSEKTRKYGGDHSGYDTRMLYEIQDILEGLSSAQPEPQWILCDERMPEEHEWIGTKKFGTTISDEVYVTFENEKGERFCQHMKFQNGELSRYDKAYMEAWYKGSKPIAWMPLPSPYQKGATT